MLDQTKLAQRLQHGLDLLLGGCYVELEQLTRGNRLSAGDLEIAVKENPQQLAFPPEKNLRQLDIIEVTDSSPRR